MSDTLYYILLNDQKAGPYTIGQLRAMWQSGAITAQTQYWFDGAADWRPLINLRSMLEPAVAPPNAQPRRVYVASPPPAKLSPGDIICPNAQCRYVGPPKREARGSGLVAILLCLLFLLPGLIYMIAMSGYNYVCPRCGVHIRGGRRA